MEGSVGGECQKCKEKRSIYAREEWKSGRLHSTALTSLTCEFTSKLEVLISRLISCQR